MSGVPTKPSSLRPPARAAVPLIGRERELGELIALVEGGARLVTVTGPAGAGKSRLALEAAGTLATSLGLTVLLPRLESRAEQAALEDAVQSAATRAGAPGKERAIAEQLAALGPTLLLLDPVDALLDRLEVVGEWLDTCPELWVLAVGRGRTQLFGERIVDLDVLSEPAAVQLFAELAAQQRPGLRFEGADREAVIAIVRTLDRLPLALELAAPRLLVMSPHALLHRLKNRWEVLTRGGGQGRHATLETAIQWSLELLEPGPRALLSEATVFRGGFTLEVAEAVLTAPTGSTVEAALLHLRERSLLSAEIAEGGAGFRLGLLSGVRLLAERELSATQKDALEEKHALAYVGAAEHWAREVELFGSAEARTQLVLEHENLAAVVERILSRPNVSTRAADRALRVLAALGSVMRREGASALLRTHLETAIQVAQGSRADPRLLARALALRGTLRIDVGRRADGERDLAEALVLASHAGDAAIEARVLVASAEASPRPAEAQALLDRARAMAEASQDKTLLCRTLLAKALVELEPGPIERARLSAVKIALEEARAEARRTGDLAVRADAERALGLLQLLEGDAAAAAGPLDEAVALATVLSDPSGSAAALFLSSIAALARGAAADAERAADESLAAARRSASPRTLARSAVLLSLFALRRGELGEASALLREAGEGIVDRDLRAAAVLVREAIDASTGASGGAAALRASLGAAPPTDLVLAARLGVPAADGASLGLGALFGLGAPRGTSARPPASRRVLSLDREGASFSVEGGAPVDLSRRRPLRRLLVHIAAQQPAAVAWDALLGVGWPGEKMRADAGAHRVRVAISTLRKMGLSAVLETDEDGYRIKKDVEVRFTET